MKEVTKLVETRRLQAVHFFLLLAMLLQLAGDAQPVFAQPGVDGAGIQPAHPLWTERVEDYAPQGSSLSPEQLLLLHDTDTFAEVKEILGEEFIFFSIEKTPLYITDYQRELPLQAGDLLLVNHGRETEAGRWQAVQVSKINSVTGQIFGYLPDLQGGRSAMILLADSQNPRQGWLFKQGQQGAVNLVLVREQAQVKADLAVIAHQAYEKINNPSSELSNLFPPGVMEWRREIIEWAKKYGLHQAVIATLMEKESGGNERPDLSPDDIYLGLFQCSVSFFPKGVNPFNPNNSAHAAFSPVLIGEGNREMSDWNLRGALRAANSLTDSERKLAINDIQRIMADSKVRRWAEKDAAYRYSPDNLDFYQAYILTAFEVEPKLVDIFLAFMAYHGGTHLIKPYDPQTDRIDLTAPRVDLWQRYQHQPVIAANVNYAMVAFVKYLWAIEWEVEQSDREMGEIMDFNQVNWGN